MIGKMPIKNNNVLGKCVYRYGAFCSDKDRVPGTECVSTSLRMLPESLL